MQWPLQPQRYLVVSTLRGALQWFGPIFFICCRNLEQTRVDSSTGLSTLRPQIAMVWSNFFICSRNLEQSRVDNTSLPLAAFQHLNARSSNLYRSVVRLHNKWKCWNALPVHVANIPTLYSTHLQRN